MGAKSQEKWWGKPPTDRCPSCGGDKSSLVPCCPNEKMRRKREQYATAKAAVKPTGETCPYCGREKTWAVCCTTSGKMRRAENAARHKAKKRERALNTVIPPEKLCPHCNGDRTRYRVCCAEERKRRDKERRDLNKKHDAVKIKAQETTLKVEPKQVKEPHKCCDCGTVTPDRRCEPCRKKWQQKHGVSTRHSSPSSEWAEW